LAWAFAVNHCAYVGTVTERNLGRVEKYFDLLIRLKANRAVWNSRFDDTLGYQYLRRLEAEVGRESLTVSRSALLAMADRAEGLFSQAQASDFGDIDLEEHISRLSIARRKLGLL
jgi:hypothetical protein